MTRTFNVLDAGCSAFISYFATANFQKYITYNITLFKTFGNITICSEKLSNYEFERRLFVTFWPTKSKMNEKVNKKV